MFLKLMIERNVPRDPGSQDPVLPIIFKIQLHILILFDFINFKIYLYLFPGNVLQAYDKFAIVDCFSLVLYLKLSSNCGEKLMNDVNIISKDTIHFLICLVLNGFDTKSIRLNPK